MLPSGPAVPPLSHAGPLMLDANKLWTVVMPLSAVP
jgi:hypothetical protein